MIEIDVLARETGLHPEVVRRLIRLGMVEPAGGTAQAPLFRPDAASRLALVLRLRRDLGLNYAGAVLAGELLARIDQLEERLRRRS
jgi:DNA-binding transcriptional MerR regulator